MPVSGLAEEYFHLDSGDFSGIWEGRLTTTHPPDDTRQFDVRMTFMEDSAVLLLKEPDETDFGEIGSCFGFRSKQDRYICNTIEHGEIWTEVFSIDQVMLTKATSHLYVRRVVDNDFTEEQESEESSRHFSTSFDGVLTKKWGRIDPPAPVDTNQVSAHKE